MRGLRLFDKWLVFGLVGLAILLIPNAEPAYAQPVGFDVAAGIDLWETDASETFQDFGSLPIPGDFFAPGCDDFDGNVHLQGVPIDTSVFGTADTRVERLNDAVFTDFGDPPTVEIQIVELNLQSVEPFQVNCEGEEQLWMLDVGLSDTPTPPGQMTIIKTDPNGGVFNSQLFVQPVFVFTHVENPRNVRILDTGAESLPPVQLQAVNVPWVDAVTCPEGILFDAASNFCPGATETGKLRIIEAGLIAAHAVWPAGSADFGDAPDPDYPTLLVNDGARHTIEPGFFMGAAIDDEPDGQPSPTAVGDDMNLVFPGVPFPLGDEDGVLFPAPLIPGSSPAAHVIVSDSGFLDAWIDFNGDGDWADAGEQILSSEPVSLGLNLLPFLVPPSATLGDTVSRFRLSRTGGLGFDGPSPHGEVEDHVVTIEGELGPRLINDDLTLRGLQTPAPGETSPGETFRIVATFEYDGLAPINDLTFVVTEAEFIDGGTAGLALINRDSGTPPGVGAELTVPLSGGVLNPGDTIEVTFDILLLRVAPFKASVDAFTNTP